MGRPRKTKRNLPSYVYCSKGRWIWREVIAGKTIREIRLAAVDATDQQIWDAYLERVGTEEKRSTLQWLCTQYLESAYFARRAPKTQRAYRSYSRRISATSLKDGRQFGQLELRQITPGALRRYLDKRAIDAPVAANREQEFLSVVFAFGVERDFLRSNPASAVKAQPERSRTRYVTHDEYRAVYERASLYVQLAMEFAYLCRLRRGEIIGPDRIDIDPKNPPPHEGLQRKHVLDEGLRVVRSKGSKEQIIGWTPRLRAAVERAKDLPGVSSTVYLLHDRRGQKIRQHAFNSAWQRTVKKAVTEAGIATFSFHDLKAKGVSDFNGDKAKASGHKSLRMVGVYDRKIETVASTD